MQDEGQLTQPLADQWSDVSLSNEEQEKKNQEASNEEWKKAEVVRESSVSEEEEPLEGEAHVHQMDITEAQMIDNTETAEEAIATA